MELVDYHRECGRLYEHCERIFEKSRRGKVTTVRKAAKALRMQQPQVLELAEDLQDQGFIIINVAMGNNMGNYAMATADWELEPLGENPYK